MTSQFFADCTYWYISQWLGVDAKWNLVSIPIKVFFLFFFLTFIVIDQYEQGLSILFIASVIVYFFIAPHSWYFYMYIFPLGLVAFVPKRWRQNS